MAAVESGVLTNPSLVPAVISAAPPPAGSVWKSFVFLNFSSLQGWGLQAGTGGGLGHGFAVPLAPLKAYTSLLKDLAQPVTTARGVPLAPLPGETLPSPSTGLALEATTAHRGPCILFPAPSGGQGAAQVSL